MLNDIYTQSQVRIREDIASGVLVVSWVGRQTETSVKDGCHRIHESMVKLNTFSILNDNRHVIGDWQDAAEWVGSVWFPQMINAGMQKFAWVQSSLDQPQASTERSMSFHENSDAHVRIFKDYNKAWDWLLERRQ